MVIEIKFNKPSGGIFGEFFNILEDLRPKYEELISERLLHYGRKPLGSINYEDRTGNLRRSTKVRGTLEDKIELYVDAPYAKYVINPRGTWKGDPFIDKGFKEAEVDKIVEQMYDEATSIWNRRSF